MDSELMVDNFVRYFRVVRAENTGMIEKTFNIRYQVYCKEFQYEREEDCPGEMEQDAYDKQSLHGLLIHKSTNHPIGCVRVICPLQNDPEAPLPYERYCKNALSKEALSVIERERGSFGEFSRLAVIASFRRRIDDEKRPLSFPVPEKALLHGREAVPLVSISVILLACAIFNSTDLKYCVAMMEPRLARMLRRCGLHFEKIGNVIDYHGRRGPFLLRRDKIQEHFTDDTKALMAVIEQQLHQNTVTATL